LDAAPPFGDRVERLRFAGIAQLGSKESGDEGRSHLGDRLASVLLAGVLDGASDAVQMLFQNGRKQSIAVRIILIETANRDARALGDTGRCAAAQTLPRQNLNGRDVQRLDRRRGAGLNRGFSGL